MAEIQEKIIKKGERNQFSRLVYAKVDKETIAGWNSDLNRILHVFNVCSVVFTWLSLTVPLQTELAINTNVAVSDVRHDVSEIRRDMSEILDGQSRSVSAAFYRLSTNNRCSPSLDSSHLRCRAIHSLTFP